MAEMRLDCHTLRKGEDNIALMAMEWNPGGYCQTWGTAERETKKLGKSWRELKLLARNRIRWREGIVDTQCPIDD